MWTYPAGSIRGTWNRPECHLQALATIPRGWFSLQSDSHRTLIWRAPSMRYHQENTIERHRHGGEGWLVWGGTILGYRPACSECNDDRPHLSGCHSGTTCTFVSGRHGC
ncbi:HTH_Tnp_Tc3_2 domain-containing protein [Trichonephila clavipes]|nr:HTH_Tnp_Tc3_2 domain-containing protein [Trichonephila clavipes]